MTEDSLMQAYNITGFWQKLVVRQQVRLLKRGDNFVFYILSNTLWMMLVMMPMLALVLKLIYVRRNYLYFQHLIFSFHVHSFQFLLFALVVLLDRWVGEETYGMVIGVAFVAAFIYTLLALKRFYQQNWLKTLAKYFLISILYFFIFMAALIGLALVSLALF
jgi:hypothetical protein